MTIDQSKVAEIIQNEIMAKGEMVPAGIDEASGKVIRYILDRAAVQGGSYLSKTLEVEDAEQHLRYAFDLPVVNA